MKVVRTYIVFKECKHQVLYFCSENAWYITSNGAFGQRDTYITPVSPNEAKRLIESIKQS